MDFNIMVGGEAGQGVQSVGYLLAKVFSRGGYFVFADQDYESRVRGGHNFYRVRISDRPVNAISDSIDILISLNKETMEIHEKEVTNDGIILYDAEKLGPFITSKHLLKVPMERLAIDTSGSALMANTIGLGAALGMTSYNLDAAEEVITGYFSGKIAVDNVNTLRAGYQFAEINAGKAQDRHISTRTKQQNMLLNGNDAISIGAIAAGCKFISAYPMTPTTPIFEYLAAKAKVLGLAVIQLEDEIAVVNAAIGASYAGVRAMTATSGGGFCLMTEGLSLAGMTETPIVIVLGQRPGPAIGLPTRTEQGELEFAIYAGHGEFPRAVLTPGNAEEAFWLTVKAFNLADKYQSPVIILTDHVIGSSYFTTVRYDISQATIDRGSLYAGEPSPSQYKRYLFTDSGISPRAFPLQAEGLLVSADSDEHNEEGHIIEDGETRTAMMKKRMKKLDGLKSDLSGPKRHGPAKSEVTLIGWGSTLGPIQEAVDILNTSGISANAWHLPQVWPFPVTTMQKALSRAHQTFSVENNATGQMAHLLMAETGIAVNGKILKYDGRPFSPAYIVEAVNKGVQS